MHICMKCVCKVYIFVHIFMPSDMHYLNESISIMWTSQLRQHISRSKKI